MRSYLRGMFLVGLIVIAAFAVLVAGGLSRPQSEQSRSIAGDSLAEAFYHTVGMATFGVAVLAIAVGLRKG